MQQEIQQFLSLIQQPPAKLTREQAAWVLGFTPDEISLLITRGLLKPLGHPAANGQKFFLAATLDDLRRDEKWFSKACDAIAEHWRDKNSRKSQDTSDDDRQGEDAPRFAVAKH